MVRNAIFFFGPLAIICMIFTTGYGQQKPSATWVGTDISSTAEPVKASASLKPTAAVERITKKSIWKEPAWYVSLAGSALDIAGSAASIDGKRVREGNPLFTRSDGKVAWERAIPFTAATMYLQYRLYKNPKHRKLAIVSMFASGIIRGTLGGSRSFAR
jgi:hypothetical protein